MKSTRYIVKPQSFDAARPFAVMATFRTFNRVIGRYETKKQAQNRARYLSLRDARLDLRSPERISA